MWALQNLFIKFIFSSYLIMEYVQIKENTWDIPNKSSILRLTFAGRSLCAHVYALRSFTIRFRDHNIHRNCSFAKRTVLEVKIRAHLDMTVKTEVPCHGVLWHDN